MKQLALKDNPAFAHMTATAADVWAVISVLKLARLLGIRFIFAVLTQYLFRDIDQSIENLETASAEQSGLVKKLGKVISIDMKLKTIFGGVRIRDMKTIPKYDKSEGGIVEKWIMANQPELRRIDWKEFEKRVKAGSVGDDCPVKFKLESIVSVNFEDLLKFHGPPSERMTVHVIDETFEDTVRLSKAVIIHPDTNPTPAPILVKSNDASQQAAFTPMDADHSPLVDLDAAPHTTIVGAPTPDSAPVPIEAAPQATGEPQIPSVDEAPAGVTVDDIKAAGKTRRAAVDKRAKQTKSDDEFPDDIPF